MKNKRIFWLSMVVVISIVIVILRMSYINKNNKNNDKITDDYIAVFHGTGEAMTTNETYIYKIDNGQANAGFKYVNVTTSCWENFKITEQGSVQWTDEIFEVAEEHNAYSYVTLPNSDKRYTIEEYMEKLLMN